MQRCVVAEQREIGREIERVEIDIGVGQPLPGDFHRVEGEDIAVRRQERLELADQPVGVEPSDQHRARLGFSQRRHGLCGAVEHLLADPCDVLDIDPNNVERGEVEQFRKALGRALWIDDRDLAVMRQAIEQLPSGSGSRRVRERLVKRIAAANIVECVDAQTHRLILHGAVVGRSVGVPYARDGRSRLQQPRRERTSR